MSSRICTYRSYLSESSTCSTHYFWKNSKGHSALLTITDASLSVADYALTYSSQSNGHVLHTAHTFRELRLIYSITQIPSSFISLQRRFVSMQRDCILIHRQRQQGLGIHTSSIEQASIKATQLVDTTLSLAGLVFFKPLKLLSRQYNFTNERLRGLVKSWDYISIVKSCSKIGYLSGKLATSTEKIFPRVIKLSLESTDVIISGLQLNHVHVHPAIYLTYSLAKSVFSTYRLWSKTV